MDLWEELINTLKIFTHTRNKGGNLEFWDFPDFLYFSICRIRPDQEFEKIWLKNEKKNIETLGGGTFQRLGILYAPGLKGSQLISIHFLVRVSFPS